MATTWVSIANSALIKLGAKEIISLTANIKSAQLCNARYEAVRDIVLRKHPWNCAIKRVVLSPSVTTPAFGYDNQFPLPSDWIRTLEVGPDAIRDNYKVESKHILANTDEIELKYIYRVTDPTTLDDLCIEAISARLAFDICFALTQSDAARSTMWEYYQDALRKAKSADAKEEPAQEIEADEFIEARHSGITWNRRDNPIDVDT